MDSPYILVSPAESPPTTDADESTADEPPSTPPPPHQSAASPEEFLHAELLFLRISFQTLESMYNESEKTLATVQEQRDAVMARSETVEELLSDRERLEYEVSRCKRKIRETESERESLEREIYEGMREREELVTKIDYGMSERERLVKEIGEFRVQVGELEKEKRESLSLIKECLIGLDEEESETETETASFDAVLEMVRKVEEYKERWKKEKRELESSVVSLTEENRDVNSLLRIALIEKEAVEKSLNKIKGVTEQKRVPLLQRVGFGFMMGAPVTEQGLGAVDSMSSTASNVSDGSECEEEVISLASTVEKIMKNLRLEITQLRKALEESRSDIERLQSLTRRQAEQITEQTLDIKELEERETLITQHVEELLLEIKAAEEDVARWREACELEVEAGKTIVGERDKVVDILQQELEKTRAALQVSNSKLKMKEELAAAAMAAQEAAERSLQLADGRASGLRERIEELTRQLEEAESRERNSRRVRRVCWPWRVLKANASAGATSANRISDVRRILPEMQALLHHSV